MIVSASWGVLIARHQQTKLVGEALTIRGIDHFIPKIETLMIVRGRHVREQRPLLGDYIPFAVSSIWKSLSRIRGVSGILMNELYFPAQVLPSEMDRLHSMCNDAGLYNSSITDTDGSGFEYGQRVTPKSNDNPFAFHVGRYESKNKRGDQTALFSLFGREQRVVFKYGDLLAV